MKIAIIVHLYYTEMWHELAHCLRSFNDIDFDLFVTTCSSSDSIRRIVYNDFPNAHYEIVENRGYDIAPFIKVLNRLDLDKYYLIAKLHTKRNCAEWVNYYYLSAKAWRRCLLRPFSSEKNLGRAISFLKEHDDVGMVASSKIIIGIGDYLESESVRTSAEMIISKLGLTLNDRFFVAGTMFLVKSKCLKPIQNKVRYEDFSIIKDDQKFSRVHISDMSHVYERVFGYLVCAQGLKISDFSICGRFMAKTDVFRRFLFLLVRKLYRFTLKPLMCKNRK